MSSDLMLNREMMALLLQAGLDVHYEGLLVHTIAIGRSAVTTRLVEAGADVRAACATCLGPTQASFTRGVTPLMVATYTWREDIATMLLAKGADVNATTEGGVSALSLAMTKPRLIPLLLAAGARLLPEDTPVSLYGTQVTRRKRVAADGTPVWAACFNDVACPRCPQYGCAAYVHPALVEMHARHYCAGPVVHATCGVLSRHAIPRDVVHLVVSHLY